MMMKITSPPLKKKKAHKRRTKKKLVFSAGDAQTSIRQVPNESNPRDGGGNGDGDASSAASQGGGGGGPGTNNTQREGEPNLKDGDASSAASQGGGGGGPVTNNTQGEGEPNLKDGDGGASSAASHGGGGGGGGGEMNNAHGEGDPKLKDGDEDGDASSSTEADSNPAKDGEQGAEAQDQSPKNKVVDGCDKIPEGDQLSASDEVVEPTEMEDVNESASKGQESEEEEEQQKQEKEQEQEDGSLENKVMGGQCNKPIEKKSSSSFTQIFTQEDAIQILKGYIDFKSESGEKTLTHFHESIKGKLHMEFTKTQVSEKLRRLKSNYCRNVNKASQRGGLSTHGSTVFELSEKIWGEDGCDSGQVVKRERVESDTIVKRGKKRQRKIVGVDMEQYYPLVHQSFNMNLGGVVALDMLRKYWTLIGSDEAEHFESEWQKLARKEMELYLKKMALFQDQAKIIVGRLKKTPNR